MKNLEHYANLLDTDNMLCYNAYICKHGMTCDGVTCRECELRGNTKECIKIMLADYQEPIRLMTWEKDLLDALVYGNNSCRQSNFYNVLCLEGMKRRYGHFRGVTDISMTLGEILANCKVIDEREHLIRKLEEYEKELNEL